MFFSGFVSIIGSFFFYTAFAHGEVTRVVVITVPYPLVAPVLAYLFSKESLSFQKALGISLALRGIFFFRYKKNSELSLAELPDEIFVMKNCAGQIRFPNSTLPQWVLCRRYIFRHSHVFRQYNTRYDL
ncbi:MAG: DMT family transporter [Deltaproteobacteria bacterium]|nr:DMT family transporter [Deltaproteobacteria bacterium]